MAISTVASGGPINADDYNLLHDRVALILGTGSGQYGYGQPLSSSRVVASNYPAQPSVGDYVTAEQLADLRSDIEKCWIHQTTAPFTLGNIAVGDEITAGSLAGSDTKTHNQYVYYVNEIDDNRLPTTSINPNEMTTTAGKRSSILSAGWNGTRNFVFTVDFGSVNDRRYFFNTGGEIRINLSHAYTGGEAKTLNWQTMVTNAPDPITCGYSIHSNLTSAWTNLYTATGSGVYAENDLIVRVKALDPSYQLQFEVRLQDDDTGDQTGVGAAVDENVQGTITCTVDEFIATGSAASIANGTAISLQPVSYTTVSSF